MMTRPIFRFAPSPNGLLHLGHAYSALINQALCRELDGKMLLRFEDIDTARCNDAYAQAMIEDLTWLGFRWEDEPLYQSKRTTCYFEYLEALEDQGLVFSAFLSRGQIKRIVAEHETQSGKEWPRDPDGVPLYPKQETYEADAKDMISPALRLDMERAMDRVDHALGWHEIKRVEGVYCDVNQPANPLDWGNVVLGRKDIGVSYHLACVVDDALSNVTHIVRGDDLFAATSVHRVLQELYGFAAPTYHHHSLIRDDEGRKLSKSESDTSLRELRAAGTSSRDIWRMIGLDQD